MNIGAQYIRDSECHLNKGLVMLEVFSRKFLLAQFCYYSNRLESLPDLRFGNHGGLKVVREYNGRKVIHEYAICNKNTGLVEICELRKSIRARLKELRRLGIDSGIKTGFRSQRVSPINGDLYKRLISESDTGYPNKTEYYHNGIHMRSRLEIMVAEELDRLGLQYKYEAQIILNGEKYFPDFIVYLPELDETILIECFGMLDVLKYAYNQGNKLAAYMNSRFETGKSLVIIQGYSGYIPEPKEIRRLITDAVNNIASVKVEIR